jgi:hypothetical protein
MVVQVIFSYCLSGFGLGSVEVVYIHMYVPSDGLRVEGLEDDLGQKPHFPIEARQLAFWLV